MKIFFQRLWVLINSIKHPKRIIAAIHGCSLECEAEKKRRLNNLREVTLNDLIGDDYPSVYPYSFLSDGSTVIDFVLLNGLAKKCPECSYLEIGTWRGESIVNVARFAKDCTSISLSEEQISKKFGPDFATVINYYCKKFVLDNITLIGADSKDFDFNLLNQKFDLIFIDGDHSYEGIVNDTKEALNCLKNKKSVIVWHDYALGMEKVRYNTLNAILESVPQDFHKYLYHVENTMCAILYFEEICSSQHKNFPRIPSNTFEIVIKNIKS